MCTLKHFSLCGNLFSKLEKNCFKVHIFILQITKKLLDAQFFCATVHIFEKTLLASLANFFGFLGYPVLYVHDLVINAVN